MKIDHLDIAYLAIGAQRAMFDDDIMKDAVDHAQDAIVGEVIEAIDIVTKLWDEQGDEFPVVWVYEVVEPLGKAIATALLHGKSIDVEATAREIIKGACA